jgi:hypothetical protein
VVTGNRKALSELEDAPMNVIRDSPRFAVKKCSQGRSGTAPWVAALCAGLLSLAGCRQAPPAAEAPAGAAKDSAAVEAPGVTLKPDEIEKMGIKMTPAAAALHAPESIGFALVVAREAIAQAIADLSTAAAVERQSRAALARGRSLAGTPGALPVEAQESAERQATVDHAALLLAERRLSATYGRSAPWKDKYSSPELAALASGESKLARVTFPLGALGSAIPAKLRLAHIGESQGGKSFGTDSVWSAPADASLPGKSFFAVVKGSDVGEGERLLARAPVGAAEAGVVIPFAAVLISGDKYWCYVEEKPGLFVRTELDPSMPTDEGYFVKEGIAAGAKVVTTSAGQLLARELASAE